MFILPPTCAQHRHKARANMPHAYDCLATLSFACLWSESTRPSSMSLNSSDVATAGMTFSADAVNPAYKPRMPWARNTRRAACQPDLIPPVASSNCICLRTVSKGCVCQAQPNTHTARRHSRVSTPNAAATPATVHTPPNGRIVPQPRPARHKWTLSGLRTTQRMP